MNTTSSQKKRFFFCLLVTAAALLPYALYGFRYFPILDDYIQYGCYPAYDRLSYVYVTIGTLATRPLASLLDPAFWGQFWPMMGFSLVLVVALHLASMALFSGALKRYDITLSPLFFLFYLLFPLGMEGRYWLSASTRIITGLFFASLSLWFLAKFINEQKSLKFFVPFAAFQLISCGFYESVAVFSVSAAVLLFCISFYKNKEKTLFLVPATSVFNIGAMFVYYRAFAGLGALGSRASDVGVSAFSDKLFALLSQVYEAFSQTCNATFLGALKGVKILFSNGFWGVFILIIALLISVLLCGFVQSNTPFSKKKSLCFFVCGAALFTAPLLPNALAAEVWITNRSLFVSIIGAALILEGFWGLFHKKQLKKVLIFLLTFLFLAASVNEYDTYRRVAETDAKLLDEIIVELDESVLCGEKNVTVLLPEEVMVPQNAFFKDHVKSVFDSDWALTGALRARTKNLSIKFAEPIIAGTHSPKENTQIIVIETIESVEK